AISGPGFGALAEAARVPILLTLPASEPSALRGGRWIFALAPTHEDLAAAALDDAELRGALEFSVYLSLERDAADPERDAFEAELARRAATRVLEVRYEPDQEAEPLVAAYLALAPSAHVLGRPREHAPLIGALRASGTDALVYLSYLTDHGELGDLRDPDMRTLWPSARRLVTPSAGSAAAALVQAYAERYGAPTAHAASAYDALSLLAAAAADVGADDPALLRDRLERSTFAGVVTTYRFRADRHAGFDPADLAFVRWSGGAPALAGLLR
ncbi:MAG: ABC transporter substrate-binding protein, partial [Candidatus Limnocylindria bacterium]